MGRGGGGGGDGGGDVEKVKWVIWFVERMLRGGVLRGCLSDRECLCARVCVMALDRGCVCSRARECLCDRM